MLSFRQKREVKNTRIILVFFSCQCVCKFKKTKSKFKKKKKRSAFTLTDIHTAIE